MREAIAFGAKCMQPGPPSPTMSEDCLTLNVWAPANAARLPVIVWLHGGGFLVGSSSDPVGAAVSNGAALARRGAVVVTLNYRLGVLGFLAHPQLSAESPQQVSGNYGLLDQVAALRWVRENIVAFGGDEHNVTIYGQSAGAGSASALMVMPSARGLFTHAIMQSAPVMRPTMLLSVAEQDGIRYGTDIAAMRVAAPAELMAKTPPLDAETRAVTSNALFPNTCVEADRLRTVAQTYFTAAMNYRSL